MSDKCAGVNLFASWLARIATQFPQSSWYSFRIEMEIKIQKQLCKTQLDKVDPFVKTQNGASLRWNFLLSD